MSSFGQDFLAGFARGLQGPVLKDYRHASDIFTPAYYGSSPKQKFTFHVSFNLNRSGAIPGLASLFGDKGADALSVLVKNIQLPSYTIAVDEMNQYNRKRYIQNKITYNPVQITFHDDNADVVRQLWYAYYSYYYRDPAYNYNNVQSGNPAQQSGFSYEVSDIYAGKRQSNDFGYLGESALPYKGTSTDLFTSKTPFLYDITIYGFNQHNFSAYTLINPIITDFAHDTYDYSNGQQPMENTMSVKYELVKYYSGAINGQQPGSLIPGFATTGSYDFIPSSISRPGSNATILGKGGLIEAGNGILNDVEQGNYLGAALKSLRTYNTFKNVNLGSVAKKEAAQKATKVINDTVRNTGPGVNPPINNNGVPEYGKFPTPAANQNQVPVTNTLVKAE